MTTAKPKPMTTAEKQRAFRRRKAEGGLVELRGVFVPAELQAQAKGFMSEWLKRRA